ncbi:hypothetical protein ERJ75_000247300 [Trypanosoma vivax]|uniref:Uncharacterized protein n=1 Tax=Trypanosoma vivax (strain Y486) TaxID=1055687 RepID=G0U1T5_TRYVY|nr:hypothetical protein TRVL_04697 [Trypanosoma vivax]KAH8618771.1 hypothetical protein ERJ75_000247300 [Trypanosoma vivax]CCC50234.1 conserved hypothetical protein [Trypanosoma vivax Y486]
MPSPARARNKGWSGELTGASRECPPDPVAHDKDRRDVDGAHDTVNEPVTQSGNARKRRREVMEGEVLHGSFILADLPTDMAAIYTRTINHMLPRFRNSISEATLLSETGSATLTFEVTNKTVATEVVKRLQNANVCGRRWNVQCYPLHSTQCKKEACLVDVRLVPPTPRSLVLRALSKVKGFLALAEAGDSVNTAEETKQDAAVVSKDDDSDDFLDLGTSAVDAPGVGMPHVGNATVVSTVVASFVDEGSAQDARAMLSGRLIAASGARMFLERRR